MGMGAYESMKARDIRPIVTDIASIDEAVMTYVEDSIVDQTDFLHEEIAKKLLHDLRVAADRSNL